MHEEMFNISLGYSIDKFVTVALLTAVVIKILYQLHNVFTCCIGIVHICIVSCKNLIYS